MNCPNPKCKGGKRISTKRTFDEGVRIHRERYCPKCKTKFYSVEFSEQDYNKTVSDLKDQIDTLRRNLQEKSSRYDSLTGSIMAMMQAAGYQEQPKKNVKGKKNGKGEVVYCDECGMMETKQRPLINGVCSVCQEDLFDN